MEEEAKRKGKTVVKIPSTKMHHLGGYEVYLVKRGDKPGKRNWVAWMMEIPQRCAC